MKNSIEIDSYLKFTSFKRLKFWDYYTLSNKSKINSNYPLVELSEVLTQRKDSIIIDDTKSYKRCRVKVRGQGIVLRDEVLGKEIKTKKQFLCKEKDFLVAEIDAKVGGYGIVPKELVNAIVSSHYFLFEIDKNKLNPEFLSIITKCGAFSKQVKATGSTNYAAIRPYHVLEYLIPLPSIEKQDKIVALYNRRINLAVEQKKNSIQLEKDIEDYLLRVLKIEKLKKKENAKGLQLISFKEVSRWDSLFLMGSMPKLKSGFPIKKFTSVISSFNKGNNDESLRINSRDFSNDDFKYIGMEHIEKETGRLLELKAVKGKEIKSQTLRVPKGYFLFGKLRPYLNKYWINHTEIENIICSSEFFVFDINDSVNKLFFKYILSSSFIQSQISEKTSGARMPRINEEIFFNLQFPLPNKQLQEEISQYITNLKNQIKELITKAKENKNRALLEFEQEVFRPL